MLRFVGKKEFQGLWGWTVSALGRLVFFFILAGSSLFTTDSNLLLADHDHKRLIGASAQDFPQIRRPGSKDPAENFDAQFTQAVIEAMDEKLSLVPMAGWANVMEALKDGRIDFLYSVDNSSQRREQLDLTAPILSTPEVVFVHSDGPRTFSLKDLPLMKLGCLPEHQQRAYMVEVAAIQCVSVPSALAGFEALSKKEIEAFIYPKAFGEALIQTYGMKGLIKHIGDPLELRHYSLAVRKGNYEMLAHLNQGLAIISENGEYQRLVSTYFHPSNAHKLIWWIAGLIFFVILAAGLGWISWRKRNSQKDNPPDRETRERLYLSNRLTLAETAQNTMLSSEELLVLLLDQNGHISRCSRGVEKLAMLSSGAMWGRYIGDFLPPVESESLASKAWSNQHSETSSQLEAPFQQAITWTTALGAKLQTQWTFTPVRPNKDDKETYYLGTGRMGLPFKNLSESLDKILRPEETLPIIGDTLPIPLTISRFSDGKLLYANPEACRVTMIPKEDFLKASASSFYRNPEQRADLLAILRAEGSVQNYNLQLLRGDGTVMDALFWMNVFELNGEKAIMVAFSDITEERKTSRELAYQTQHNALLKQIAVAANESDTPAEALTTSMDLICRYTGWSTAHYFAVDQETHKLIPSGLWHMTDVENNTLLEQTTKEFLDQLVEGPPGKALQTKQPVWAENLGYEPNFARRTAWASLNLHFGCWVPIIIKSEVVGLLEFFSSTTQPRDGKLIGLLTDFGNILGRVFERDLAHQKELDGEERLGSLIENTSDIISIVDRKGILLFCASSLEQTLGFAPDEVVGTNLFDYIHEEDKANMAAGLVEMMRKQGGSFSTTLRIQHKNGSWILLEGTVKNELHIPSIKGFVINGRDVTELRQQEEQLRQSQKLESLGHLTGGVAHDFNNLLQVIAGNTELALDEIPKDSDTFPLLKTVLNACVSASGLTRQLLAFGRQQVLTPQQFDLNTLISDLMKMLHRLIGEHVELKLIPGEDLGPIYADPGMLEQVLMNLSVNARDAMPQGGQLTIETGHIEIDAQTVREHPAGRVGTFVTLSVSDTGTGISKENQRRIFEPYFTTKDIGEGTGLGLATVFGILQQHNGWIELDSFPGQGTRFTAFLPTTPAKTEQPVTEAETKPVVGGKETILVAEDSPEVQELIVHLLESKGYSVLAAKDGIEALELFTANMEQVDLALLDVVMPRLSGRGAFLGLRKLRPDLPVLFCTGYTANEVDTEFVLEHQLRLVQKPFRPEDLYRAVRELLDDVRTSHQTKVASD